MFRVFSPLLTYFPRARWFPWRQRLVKQRNTRTQQNKIAAPYPGFRPEKAEAAASFSFTSSQVPLSLKKLQRYSQLLRHRHLQDAIDWLAAISRPSARPLSKLLLRAQQTLVNTRGLDAARLFVATAVGERGRYERRLFLTRDGGTKVRRHAVNKFQLAVEEMPLPQFFHRVYVEKRVPRCIVLDMQAAVRDLRAVGPVSLGFLPYLTSETRRTHRKSLALLAAKKQWDYFSARDRWIANYSGNTGRHENAARLARGLLPRLPNPSAIE